VSSDWTARLKRALDLARDLSGDASWTRRVHAEIVPPTLGNEGADFLEWARSDPFWALVLAECAGRVCAKPAEAAAFVLVDGLRQILVDEGRMPDED
jgi:hypothetical protein